jgi:hypothetical protein
MGKSRYLPPKFGRAFVKFRVIATELADGIG